MEELPLHNHTKQLNEIKCKAFRGKNLKVGEVAFLFETIEQLEGELKEWIDLYEENIKKA